MWEHIRRTTGSKEAKEGKRREGGKEGRRKGGSERRGELSRKQEARGEVFWILLVDEDRRDERGVARLHTSST